MFQVDDSGRLSTDSTFNVLGSRIYSGHVAIARIAGRVIKREFSLPLPDAHTLPVWNEAKTLAFELLETRDCRQKNLCQLQSHRQRMVGAIGIEPTTPTVSR